MPLTTQPFRGAFRSVLTVIVGLPLATAVAAQVPPPPTAPTGAPPSQTIYPLCQPPAQGEYLLLVVSKTPETQNQVRQVLPSTAKSTICNYLDDVVTRVSGFTTVDTANAWAKYLSESAGLSAFVARPPETPPSGIPEPSTATAFPTPSSSSASAIPLPKPTPGNTSAPSQSAASSSSVPFAFSPRLLGTGYAVLVNYFNRPETAVRVHQLLSKEIGLASYGQRPYLLAVHTTDQAIANATLQTLTDQGLWAMVVDSRRVTLLKQSVALSPLKK